MQCDYLENAELCPQAAVATTTSYRLGYEQGWAAAFRYAFIPFTSVWNRSHTMSDTRQRGCFICDKLGSALRGSKW